MMLEATTPALRDLWRTLAEYSELSDRAGISENACLFGAPIVCIVSGDSWTEISVDASGTYSLTYMVCGSRRLEFVTNSSRAVAVQLALQLFEGHGVSHPVQPAFNELPKLFAVSERNITDDAGHDVLVVHLNWDDTFWAELLGSDAHHRSHKWAWMFNANGKTITRSIEALGSRRFG